MLVDLHLDLARLGLLGLRQLHGEHAVLEARADRFPVGVAGVGLALSLVAAVTVAPALLDSDARPIVLVESGPAIDDPEGRFGEEIPANLAWADARVRDRQINCDVDDLDACIVVTGTAGHVHLVGDSHASAAVAMFTELGVEPFGRIAAGISELAAVVLLLIPATAALGGLMAAGMMVGAIGSHLAVLGIEVNGDGGLLFGMAIVVLLAGLTVASIRRQSLPIIGR